MAFATNGSAEAHRTGGGDPSYYSKQPTGIKCILLGDSGIGKTSLVVSYTTNDYPSEHKPSALDTFCVEVCADNRPVHLQICDAGGGDEVASLRHFSYPGVHVILLCFSVVKPQSFRSLRSVWLHELTEACVVLNPMAAKLAAAYRPSGDTDSKADQQLKPHPNGAKSHQSGCRVGRRGSTKGARHADESSTIPGPAFLLVGCACDLRNDIGQLLELSKQGEEPVDKVTAERLAADIGAEAYVECSALTQKNLKTVFDLAIWCGLKVADLGGPACRPKVNDYLTNNHANHSSGPPTDSSKKFASPPKHRAHGTSAERNHQGNNSIIPASPKHDRSIWRKFLCIS